MHHGGSVLLSDLRSMVDLNLLGSMIELGGVLMRGEGDVLVGDHSVHLVFHRL